MEERERSAYVLAPWIIEALGWAVALLLAFLAVAHLDATDRSWMLYYDPETMLPALVRGSVLAGEPQNWALSAVLFIPEMALYFALAALGLGIKGTFALNAVVNFLLLYGSLRLLSGLVRRERSRGQRVAGALLAFAGAVVLTCLEQSSRWDTFELVSLLATATFYSMTVLASVVTTGLVAPLAVTQTRRRRRWHEALLVALAGLSTLTNPLYLAWEAVPLGLVLALLAWRRVVGWRTLLRVTAVLMVGGIIGLLARLPFASLITKDGPAYAKPGLSAGTAVYYAQLLLDRTSTLEGAVSLILVLALVLASALAFRHCVRSRDASAAVVAGMGWIAPVAVVVGAVFLGAVGTRYLQPVFFAPLCTLVLAPELFARSRALRRISQRGIQAVVAGVAVVCLTGSAVVTASLSNSSARIDADIRCVDSWILDSQRVGAGRFWTIRGPKAYLSEPYRLIQVDDSFNAYPWLTDRSDYSNSKVSFVLSDNQYPPPALPAAAGTAPHHSVSCGRYTITDFGSDILPLGPGRPDSKP